MDAGQEHFDNARPAAPITGTWALRFATAGEIVSLTLRRTPGRELAASSIEVPLTALPGLSTGDLLAPRAQVRFALTRDPGALAFEGRVGQGQGSGGFEFEPGAAFGAALPGLGYKGLTADELYSLTIHDIGLEFLRELGALGHEGIAVPDLLEMRIHRIGAKFVRELQDLGYRYSTTVQQMLLLRIHGVTAAFIRQLQDLGYVGVSVDDLLELRIHGVTPRFIRQVRDRGHADAPVADLLEMRIHGAGAYR
ncbi:hypothetical protein [Nocardia sp. NPDC048505]|uniref:hypothetical protein n=1 Tax=unclassified Nocardia TaxID=2637762 RepID=UPI0033E4ED54